jgi:FkbM family methyltransferase
MSKEQIMKEIEKDINVLETDHKSTNPAYSLNADIYYSKDGIMYLAYKDVSPSNVKMSEIMIDFLLHGKEGYEPETTKIVKGLIKEGDVCADIGASIGYFSLLFAKLSKTGRVHSIEPARCQHEYFMKNMIANNVSDRVKLYDCAAWDKEEEIEMFSSALLKGTNTKVRCIPIDKILEPLDRVDFIKIDVDGSEVQTIKGLQKTIAKNPNLRMIIEYYPKYLKLAGNDPQELMALLEKDFTLTKVEKDYGNEYWNYLCIRK